MTELALNDEGTVGLDHLGAARSTVNQSSLTLLQSLLSFLVRSELNESEGHVLTIATDLDPTLAVLHELPVDTGLESDIILGLRKAGSS